MAETSAVLKGYLSVFTGDLGRLLVFAAFIPLLVRTVGESGFGTYALVMALFLPFRKLLNFGLFEATKTFASRSDEDYDEIVSASFTLHLGLLVVGLPILFAGITTFVSEAAVRNSLLLVLGAIAGEQLYYFGRGVLHADKQESAVEWLIPARSIILMVVGLWLARSGYGVPGVFAGFATGFLLTGLYSTARALTTSRLTIPSRAILRRYWPPLLRFGAPSMALVLLNVGLYKIDILLVSYFMTPADTGYYRAALQVAEFIWIGAVAMELVMIQSTADLWARGATERVTALLSKLLKYVVAFTALLVVGVFVLGDSFVTVYFGEAFHRSIQPLRLLLPGVLGFAIARIIWPVLQAGGHLRGILAATGTAVGLNVVLNVLLIPRFGIIGAAVATSMAYGLMAVFHTVVARQVSVRPFDGLPAFRILGIALVTAGALALLDPFAPWYLDLTLLPLVGLVVFVFGLFQTGVLTRTEVRDLFDSSGLGNGSP